MNGFPKEISRCIYKLLYDEVIKELFESYGTKLLLKLTPQNKMCEKIKEDTIQRYLHTLPPVIIYAYINYVITGPPRWQMQYICYPLWLQMFLFERKKQ